MKDGLYTTEFWAAVAVTVASLLFTFQGDVMWADWTDLMKWVWGAYFAARAIPKAAAALAVKNGNGTTPK